MPGLSSRGDRTPPCRFPQRNDRCPQPALSCEPHPGPPLPNPLSSLPVPSTLGSCPGCVGGGATHPRRGKDARQGHTSEGTQPGKSAVSMSLKSTVGSMGKYYNNKKIQLRSRYKTNIPKQRAAVTQQQGRECERGTLPDRRARSGLFLTLAQHQGARKKKTEHVSMVAGSQSL